MSSYSMGAISVEGFVEDYHTDRSKYLGGSGCRRCQGEAGC